MYRVSRLQQQSVVHDRVWVPEEEELRRQSVCLARGRPHAAAVPSNWSTASAASRPDTVHPSRTTVARRRPKESMQICRLGNWPVCSSTFGVHFGPLWLLRFHSGHLRRLVSARLACQPTSRPTDQKRAAAPREWPLAVCRSPSSPSSTRTTAARCSPARERQRD